MGFEESTIQRRRSERVAKSLPIVVRGVDLLGQEFEERTATLSFNLHGCRYASRYHLPKNTWITLEIARGSESRNARARVAWIQRPHSVREFFQINAELEAPQNIWLFEEPPAGWAASEADSPDSAAASQSQSESQQPEMLEEEPPNGCGAPREKVMNEMNAMNDMPSVSEFAPHELAASENPETAEHPLLRELRAELERRAALSPEESAALAEPATPDAESKSWLPEGAFEKWKQEFEEAQVSARGRLTDFQSGLLSGIRSEFDANLSEARRLIEEIEKNRQELHAENKAAAATAVRLAQERLEAGAARDSQAAAEPPKAEFSSLQEATSEWRERFQSEMSVAQSQWNELLQSSLDRGVRRMIAHLSQSSEEIAREAGTKLSEHVHELRQPLLQNVAEARETLSSMRTAVDEELSRAKSSLTEIEHSISRMGRFSTEIDAATRNALDELNRRLNLVLDAQTREMGERAEAVTTGSIEKVTSALESLKQQVIGGAAAEIESKLAPHMARLPEILRELSTKELHLEDSLRLHRERLRQASESSERELLARFTSAAAESRKALDASRHEAAAKLSEDIEARVSLASQAAAGAMEKASQGFDDAARHRLQALIEEGLAAGVMTLAENVEDAKRKFASDLETESSGRVAQIREHLDGFTGELTGRARTQIEEAAEVTATAFGQVLRGLSDQEVEHFTTRTAGRLQEQTEQLEASAAGLLRNFETSVESSLARLHQQMAAQLETSIAEGRSALSSEFNSSLASYRLERETHEKEWAESLERLSSEASARFQDRISTAGDSCVVSSVRRLNEHGQNVLESLMRSADQALRESCAKLFDGFAEILRERSPRPEFSGHSSGIREAAEAAPPPPPNDSALNQPSL